MSRNWTLVVLLVVLCVWPVVAAADSGRLLLPFGSTYMQQDGGSAVHRGADVALAADASVESVASGDVSFAGRVPSAAGGSVLAVSVRDGDDVITLTPLATLEVAKGDVVDRGDRLGVVAAAGDPSSAEPHLHVSLRRDGVYLDPSALLTGMLAAAPAPEAQIAVPEPGGESVVAAPQVAAPVAESPVPDAGVAVVGAVTVPAPSVAIAVQPAGASGAVAKIANPSTVLASRSAAEPVSQGCGEAVSSDAETVEDVQQAPVLEVSAEAVDQVPISRPVERLARASTRELPHLAASPLGVTSVIVAFMSSALLLTRRRIQRRFQSNPPVSDRFGSMLQHLRAGDTLCGLTSCSGLLPSQSRGRLAQRR